MALIFFQCAYLKFSYKVKLFALIFQHISGYKYHFFLKNLAVYEIMWKKYGRARQKADDNKIAMRHPKMQQYKHS